MIVESFPILQLAAHAIKYLPICRKGKQENNFAKPNRKTTTQVMHCNKKVEIQKLNNFPLSLDYFSRDFIMYFEHAQLQTSSLFMLLYNLNGSEKVCTC